MFDFKLFRKPTFVGGAIAAFGMNGSLFAMLLYITLYFQEDLHFSALGTGLRVVVITGGSLITAIPAGQLSQRIPVRWLIGPGLVLVGIGLLLMGGIGPNTGWTHMILGFAIAGAGSGMVNPPLASTAVGVVQPHDAGMASGINTTFRQVGIATAIAALGSIFATKLGGASAVTFHARFADAINELLLISGLTAIVAGVLAMVLIRQQDFVTHRAAEGSPAQQEQEAVSV
jgi:predicted MFS family arabinose efflux permease